jgi:O-antigen ligase
MKFRISQDLIVNSKNSRSVFQAAVSFGIAILAARALMFTFSLPEKYSLTLSLALVVAPLAFIFRNKEKLLMGAFLFSLPVGMGYMLIERVESTNSAVVLYFQLYLCDIFLILLVFICLFKMLLGRNRFGHSIWQSRMIIPLLLWIGMCFVSLIPAIDRTATFVEITRIGRIFLTFICIFYYVKERQDIHFILKCLLLALLLQAFLMFAQYATNSLVIRFPGSDMALDIAEQGMRPSGTMAHSSHFAKFSGLILTIALGYVFFAPRLRNKFLMLSTWICGSVALILTISRAGLAAWLLSMVLFFAGVIILRIVPIRRAVPLFVIGMLLSAGGLYLVGGQRLKSRMKHDTGSSAARIPMYEVAFNVIKAHPIVGVGLKNYTLVHQDYDHTPEHISVLIPDFPVHNLFLLYAAEIGIPGLLFFLWFIWKLLKGSLRCANYIDVPVDKAIYLSMAIGLIALLLQSATGMGVTNHLIHLSVMAIFAACVSKQCLFLNNYKGKRVNPPNTRY